MPLPFALPLLLCALIAPLHADDSAAIQARLNAAAETGAAVVLEPGEYHIGRTLVLRNATLTGPGAVLRATNPEGNTGYLFGVALGSDSVLRDISLVGEGPRCVPVQIPGGAHRIQIRNVTVTGGTILIDSNSPDIGDILIDGCNLNEGGYGVLLDRECSGANVRITGCHFRGNRSDAIELNFPDKPEGKFVRNVTITGCIFEDIGGDPNSATSGFGVGIAGGHNVQIVGNSFYRCGVQGVHLEDDAEHITVSANNFEDCGLGCTTGNWTGGVHVLSGTRYVTVSANNFSRCRFGVSGLQGNTLRYLTVQGNTFRECERGAWFMQYPCGTFQGNILQDCGIGLELWRSARWIVTGNLISAAPRGDGAAETVGVRCFGYRELICTNNTLDVDVPFDHSNTDWYDEHALVQGNLVLRGRSRLNGEPEK